MRSKLVAIKKTGEDTSVVTEDTSSDELNPQPEEEPDERIRKKNIYDHVTVTTGLRKREVREAVDATLAYFHKCLSEGKDLHIPPLGKIRSIERGEGEKTKLIHKVVLQTPKSDEKIAQEAKEALAKDENAD